MAKVYDINPELVEDRGFVDMLQVRASARVKGGGMGGLGGCLH